MAVNFSLVTRPYTTENTVKVALYKTASPTVVYKSQELQGPLEQTEWAFPGLDIANYICKIYEVTDGSITQTFDSFTIVPANKGAYLMKESIWVTAGVTDGFNSGVDTNTMDDWAGWDIIVEREGGGTMVVNDQYFWDKTSGTITLAYPGDAFGVGERLFIQFVPQQTDDSTGGIPETSGSSIGFGTLKTINADYTVSSSDFGNKLLALDGPDLFAVTLPDINTITPNQILYIEVGIGTTKNIQLNTASGQNISFIDGDRQTLYINQNEFIAIYKHQISTTQAKWRIHSFQGNFLQVGLECASYGSNITGGSPLNRVRLDGANLNVSQYARLYNDFVLKLPTSQVIDYASWTTSAATQAKYSLANANGIFRTPNLTGLFLRNAISPERTSEFQATQNLSHFHPMTGNINPSTSGEGGIIVGKFTGKEAINDVNVLNGTEYRTMELNGGDEARPNNYAALKFIYV
ncbi:hypothetical protein [Rhizosphaericola mali]|uniref:Uncharacterized protein n=1 Tax=Rhizosphaericola mali TaxID=2545455 RepID=A0A5P2FZA1_9BACT|nr:hypothetical protein [Rhizosphaericola mali]QES88874.1 hypothetical protein E0W69_009470 [Rhizosphaericola mali]